MSVRFKPDFKNNRVTDTKTGETQQYSDTVITTLAAVLFNQVRPQETEHWISCPTCMWQGVANVQECVSCGEHRVRRLD